MAIQGKAEFIKHSNPFGGGKGDKEPAAPEQWPPSDEKRKKVASDINRAFSSLASHPQKPA